MCVDSALDQEAKKSWFWRLERRDPIRRVKQVRQQGRLDRAVIFMRESSKLSAKLELYGSNPNIHQALCWRWGIRT